MQKRHLLRLAAELRSLTPEEAARFVVALALVAEECDDSWEVETLYLALTASLLEVCGG